MPKHPMPLQMWSYYGLTAAGIAVLNSLEGGCSLSLSRAVASYELHDLSCRV